MRSLKEKKIIKPIKPIIGYYTLSVLLTYMSVASAATGIYFCSKGNVTYALLCLVFCGICDSFDGKVARACKRSEEEKSFGIQIDSLADMVAFIFLPITIFYAMGLNNWHHAIIYGLYALNGVIRLAYFNVIAEESKKINNTVYYHGLPVTSAAVIFPVTYLLKNVMNMARFNSVYMCIILFVAILFVLNFQFKKPKSVWIYIFVVFGLIVSSLLLFL